MPHRTFTAGDTDYITRMNALASSLDRRLAQNILVNGSMQVWQRGTSFASAASVVYSADRWSHWRGSFATGSTVSRQTGSDPSRYCARVQRDSGNASTALVYIAQALTTENSIPLRGKRLGIRFRARAGANFSASASALSVQVFTGTGTDQHPTVYTGSATPLSTSVTLTTSWQYFTADLGGTVGGTVTELSLGFLYTPVGTASTNDYFEIQEVQLVATTDSNVDVGDYPWRSFEQEFDECQAYYEKSFAYATAPAQNAGTTNTIGFAQALGASTAQYAPSMTLFKRRKRGTPTVTCYNPSAANAQIRNLTGSTDWTSSSLSASDIGMWATGTSPGGSSAGDRAIFHFAADAEL